MKTFFILIILFSAINALASTFVLEVTFQERAGNKWRRETVFEIGEYGEKIKVAEKVFLDSTNELKNVWSSELGLSAFEDSPPNVRIVEAHFAKVKPALSPTPSRSIASTDISACKFTEDHQSITCPDGTYVLKTTDK